MKKLLFVISIICLQSFSYMALAYTKKDILQSATSRNEVASSLVLNQQWVRYPAYSNRSAWNHLLGPNKSVLIKAGEKLLHYKWQLITATSYLEYERSGNRNAMQVPQKENRRALNILMLAELAEGKGRFIDQIIDGVMMSCETSSWALAAHLKPYQKTKRALPDFREEIIDLGAGGYGALLSWVYYFFHDTFNQIDPIISLRLKSEIDKRILTPYLNRDDYWWMAFHFKKGMVINNWNPWCNSNVLQCFLLTEENSERLVKAVYKTICSVDQFINFVKSDGACEEGPSYWGHAAGKLYDYLQLLSDATHGKISYFDEPIVRRMGEYISRSYVGNGWVVNFADASAKGGGDPFLIYRYGKAVNSSEMMHFAAYLIDMKGKKISYGDDAFRLLEDVRCYSALMQESAAHTVPDVTWYPETEFCYMKNEHGYFLAAKGGFNHESHNHNDAGSFMLYLNEVPLFIDAGVGTYTAKTFSKERYSIWTMQSDYHNLPRINGVSQKNGHEYKATSVLCNPLDKVFQLDLSKAYPQEAYVDKWERKYHLKENALEIEDSYSLSKSVAENEIMFLVRGEVALQKEGLLKIIVDNQEVEFLYPSHLLFQLETIQLRDKRLSKVWGKEIYRIHLTDTQKSLTGNYKFTIREIK